jgi:hypothetical protein
MNQRVSEVAMIQAFARGEGNGEFRRFLQF